MPSAPLPLTASRPCAELLDIKRAEWSAPHAMRGIERLVGLGAVMREFARLRLDWNGGFRHGD